MKVLNRKNGAIENVDSILSKRPYGAKAAIGGQAKRLFDVVFCSLILLLTLPLFLIVAVILKVTDPGPVIYKQVRVGFWGRRFTCFKFRTMVVDSENVLRALLDDDPGARAEWEQNQKLIKDPRVTPVGQFLRESSLDELPQLINVLRGEMSLIGPRPIVPSEIARYGDRLSSYASARPGLTGAWQISGRSDCGYDKRVELDANYVSNWRFSTDLLILLRTLGPLSTGREVTDGPRSDFLGPPSLRAKAKVIRKSRLGIWCEPQRYLRV